ncbi:MAG: RibD family protein [Planctomycetota bacterium]
MYCAVEDPVNDQWSALLELRRYLHEHVRSAPSERRVALVRRDQRWAFSPAAAPPESGIEAVIQVPIHPTGSSDDVLVQPRPGGLDVLPAFLRLYLPIVLGAQRAAQRGSVFITGHLAQTLDGRIACHNGSSQWIGNRANLLHAHRLRALHDAVMVGGRTVERDNPQLTVRHVEGDDPHRIVLNGSASVLRTARRFKVFEATGSTVLCRRTAVTGLDSSPAGAEVVPLDPTGEWIAPAAVRAELAARGRRSVYLEGGGQTLSRFLAAGELDVLHVHVAPIILGSGIPSFSLPEVGQVADGLRLRTQHFTMGDELLLACHREPEPQ